MLLGKGRLVGAALANRELREHTLLVGLPGLVVCLLFGFLAIHLAPSGVENFFSANLECHILNLALNGSSGKTAVGIEHSYEAACY